MCSWTHFGLTLTRPSSPSMPCSAPAGIGLRVPLPLRVQTRSQEPLTSSQFRTKALSGRTETHCFAFPYNLFIIVLHSLKRPQLYHVSSPRSFPVRAISLSPSHVPPSFIVHPPQPADHLHLLLSLPAPTLLGLDPTPLRRQLRAHSHCGPAAAARSRRGCDQLRWPHTPALCGAW